jgi:hypothetical protein
MHLPDRAGADGTRRTAGGRMRALVAGLALLFASASFAQASLAMPEVDVSATRVQRVPPLALTLPQGRCDIAIPPGVGDASDALTFASGPFAEVADVQALDRLAPLVSISWSEGFHFFVVGAPVPTWPRLQFGHRVWYETVGC